jgi:hypothetical protein
MADFLVVRRVLEGMWLLGSSNHQFFPNHGIELVCAG